MKRLVTSIRLVLLLGIAVVAVPRTSAAQPSAASGNAVNCFECLWVEAAHAFVCYNLGPDQPGYAKCEPDSWGCVVSGPCEPMFATTSNVDATGTRRVGAKDRIIVADDLSLQRSCNGAILKRQYALQKIAAIKNSTLSIKV